MTTDLWLETHSMQVRTQWSTVTEVLKEKIVNLEFFTQQKYLSKNKGKINTL